MASVGVRALGALALVVLSACSLGTDADDKPGSARVRVEGTTPHPLTLITSTDFFEQLDVFTGETWPVLERADTVQVTLPFDRTVSLGTTGSIYVELRNALVPTASVRLRVELDNGQGYDQSATLSDKAALIFYWLYTDYSYR